MMIEIHGAWVHNKGAHLMLQTAADRLRRASADVECCMEAYPDPYIDRAACKMFQIFPLTLQPKARLRSRAKYGVIRALGRVLGPKQRHRYGLTLRSDIDALVDVSGYRLGDAWGNRNLEWMAYLTGQYRKSGKPVVLLPQMFGPFKRPGAAGLFRRILENADLVYARERISLEHAKSVGGRQDHIHLAPDVTIFADPPDLIDVPLSERDYACVIPNMRIMDKGQSEWAGIYLDRLEQAARVLLQAGLRVPVVLHDQCGQDAKLASELLQRLDSSHSQVYCESDPLRMKAFVAGARMLVGSRFHALVGGLAIGVPVIALGWAHKYDMLLEDFGVRENLYESSSKPERLTGMIEEYLDDGKWQTAHHRILAARAGMARANEQMWEMTLSVLGLQQPAEAPHTSLRGTGSG